jgi:hypothetical protein
VGGVHAGPGVIADLQTGQGKSEPGELAAEFDDPAVAVGGDAALDGFEAAADERPSGTAGGGGAGDEAGGDP